MLKNIQSKSEIHDEKSLAEFMAIKQTKRDPLDFVQWRMFVFQDYKSAESLVVFKAQSAVADVTALMLMLYNLQDEPSIQDMP